MNLKLEIMKASIIYLIFHSFLFQSYFSDRVTDIKDSSFLVVNNYKIREDSKLLKSKQEFVNDSIITVLENNTYRDIPIYKINEFKVSKFLTLKNLGLEWEDNLVVVGFNLQW